TPLEHPSSVSALRADPPSPTRGEGRITASPPHAVQTSSPRPTSPVPARRARRFPYAQCSGRKASGRRRWRRNSGFRRAARR
ncbi:MAG: hypothetical protein EOQ44_36060, partial [Mesorhizobium sp.]